MKIALKITFCTILVSFCINDGFAKVTEWKPAVQERWDEPLNWTNGIPTPADSAIIDVSGTEAVIVMGFAAEAMYLFVGATSTLAIESMGSLGIANSPATGIFLRGEILNEGHISVTRTDQRGIDLAFNSGANFVNNGSTIIEQTGFTGLYLGGNTTFENNFELSVSDAGSVGGYGIELNHVGTVCVLTNKGKIDIMDTVRPGLLTRGLVDNLGLLTVTNAVTEAASIPGSLGAIVIDSTSISGTIDIVGELKNTGDIVINNSVDVGLIVDNGCDLTNELGGTIEILNSTNEGMIARPQSKITCTDPNSKFLMQSSGGTPLEVHELSVFSIDNSALLEVEL